MLTTTQTRLIRSISLRASNMRPKARNEVLIELLTLRSIYEHKECGITYEDALSDLYERTTEKREQTEVAA